MLSAQHLEQRRAGLGGSDAAAILGLSPWKTALEVWLEKTGQAPETEPTPAMYWGSVLEDVVAAEYAKRSGHKIQRRNLLQTHPRYPYLCGFLDRVAVANGNGPGVIECKTARALSEEWGEEGTDALPGQYYAQVLHYLAVTGYRWAEVPVLFLANRAFRIYRIAREEALIDELVETEATWWQRHIIDGIQPEGDWDHPGASALLDKLYPGTNGETLTLPEEAIHWHAVAEQSAALERQYRASKEAATAHLKALMGEAAVGKIPGLEGGYTRKEVRRKGFEAPPCTYIDFKFRKKIAGD